MCCVFARVSAAAIVDDATRRGIDLDQWQSLRLPCSKTSVEIADRRVTTREQLLCCHHRTLAGSAMDDEPASARRHGLRVERRQRIEQCAVNSFDGVLVGLAHVDEQNFPAGQVVARLITPSTSKGITA